MLERIHDKLIFSSYDMIVFRILNNSTPGTVFYSSIYILFPLLFSFLQNVLLISQLNAKPFETKVYFHASTALDITFYSGAKLKEYDELTSSNYDKIFSFFLG